MTESRANNSAPAEVVLPEEQYRARADGRFDRLLSVAGQLVESQGFQVAWRLSLAVVCAGGAVVSALGGVPFPIPFAFGADHGKTGQGLDNGHPDSGKAILTDLPPLPPMPSPFTPETTLINGAPTVQVEDPHVFQVDAARMEWYHREAPVAATQVVIRPTRTVEAQVDIPTATVAPTATPKPRPTNTPAAVVSQQMTPVTESQSTDVTPHPSPVKISLKSLAAGFASLWQRPAQPQEVAVPATAPVTPEVEMTPEPTVVDASPTVVPTASPTALPTATPVGPSTEVFSTTTVPSEKRAPPPPMQVARPAYAPDRTVKQTEILSQIDRAAAAGTLKIYMPTVRDHFNGDPIDNGFQTSVVKLSMKTNADGEVQWPDDDPRLDSKFGLVDLGNIYKDGQWLSLSGDLLLLGHRLPPQFKLRGRVSASFDDLKVGDTFYLNGKAYVIEWTGKVDPKTGKFTDVLKHSTAKGRMVYGVSCGPSLFDTTAAPRSAFAAKLIDGE